MTADPAPRAVAASLLPGRALPGAAYTGADLFAWEMEMLWNRAWTPLDRGGARHRAHWLGRAWSTTADLPAPATWFGNLGELLSGYDLPALTPVETRCDEVAANWKLIMENYLECYHCATTHPELSQVQRTRGGEDFVATGNWLGGVLELRNTARTMSLDGSGPDWSFPGLAEDAVRQVRYHAALPGLFVTAMPDYVVVHRLEPLTAAATRVVCTWLFHPDLLAACDPGYAVDFWGTTNAQDYAACESVQRGVSNRRYVPGPLGTEESALQRFLEEIGAAYAGTAVARRPAPARAAV